jgi:hypothetical protein
MSYCIHVQPEVGVLLRTLAPYVVLHLGQALAELADAAAASPDGVVRFVIDHARRLLDVIHVEQRDPLS